jgi:hypothetical protein
MNKGSIKRLARSLANRQGTSSVPDTSTSVFDADTAFEIAIKQYFEKTDSLPCEKEVDCVKDQKVYPYSHFEAAGQGAIYRIDYIGFDSRDLTKRSLTWLDDYSRGWRYAASGTPLVWTPYGERQLMTYPAPDAVKKIRAFGYCYPAAATYDTDADVPPIIDTAHPLIAVYMAMLFEFGLAADEDALRASSHWQTWENGTKSQSMRVHPAEAVNVADGRVQNGLRDLVDDSTLIPLP